jgi:hypothetical protein
MGEIVSVDLSSFCPLLRTTQYIEYCIPKTDQIVGGDVLVWDPGHLLVPQGLVVPRGSLHLEGAAAHHLQHAYVHLNI